MCSKQHKRFKFDVFTMITGINEWKILLKKRTSCECNCKSDGRKYNSNQKWNNDKCWCECKNPKEHNACEKDYIWNPSIVFVRMINI